MLSMWRLLSVSLAAAVTLSAATQKDIVRFVKKGLNSNESIQVLNVKVLEEQPLQKPKGWDAFVVEFKLKVNKGGREQIVKDRDILFASDRYVAPDLIDVKTNRSLKSQIILSVDQSFYNKEHLLYGNPNAKHKIVIFSDPLCPFCREVMPELMRIAKRYPNTFALYYYHLPLKSLHPASVPLAKAIIFLKNNGRKDLIEKIYKTPFDYEEKDEAKVLQDLNRKLGLRLTLSDINRPEVLQELQADMNKARDLMIHGTPTVFVDGKYDKYRTKYKAYIPKSDR